MALCAPVASRLWFRKMPRDTNQPPQIKNSRNIIKDNWNLVVVFIWKFIKSKFRFPNIGFVSAFIKYVIQGKWSGPRGPEFHHQLPPVVGGMVDDVEQYVPQFIGKGPALAVGVFHPFLKIFGIGDQFKGGALVPIVHLLPLFKGMHIPYPVDLGLPQHPLVPDMVGIEDVAEQPLAIGGQRVHVPKLLDHGPVAVEIVIEELL
jgi:hypothetical protein